jgi:hypothetical protein
MAWFWQRWSNQRKAAKERQARDAHDIERLLDTMREIVRAPQFDAVSLKSAYEEIVALSRNAVALDAARKAFVREIAEACLADGLLDAYEEARLWVVKVVCTRDCLSGADNPVDMSAPRFVVARSNAGSLLENPQSGLLTSPGEKVWLLVPTTLTKEVTDRQWVGRSSGVSVRVMRGVTVRSGQSRRQSVVVGKHTEQADTGHLAVTSQRVVFAGKHSTWDAPIGKLVGVQPFTDGVQFNVSGRVKAPLFLLGNGWGDAVAATVASVARGEPTSDTRPSSIALPYLQMIDEMSATS